MTTSNVVRRGWRYARVILLALLTPLLEKNPSKTKVSRCHVPVVLSMARVVVLLFAGAMLRLILMAGVAGWPDATLSIAVVLAIPLLSALERIKPEDTVAFMKSVFARFGSGGVRPEPGIYDDHRGS